MKPPDTALDDAQMEKKRFRNLLWGLGLLVTAALIGVIAFNLGLHQRVKKEREKIGTTESRGPEVSVGEVKNAKSRAAVTLPGDVKAFRQASIYAKVQGYVGDIRVDKGDRVVEGQILGTIESPETDQQVSAAKADLNIKLRTLARAKKLAPEGVVSQQDLDVAVANVGTSSAALKRAEALRDYETLRAPFDGVVTQRYLDPGALVPNSPTGVPFVDVTDPSKLRVTVYVGQDVATFLKVGNAADLVQDERPTHIIHAQVTRVADALDPRTRTMLVEVELDNRESKLIPGVFVHVTLHLEAEPLPTVPTEALLVRNDQNVVATIVDNKVHFEKVTPGTNDGRSLQLRSKLKEGTVVALNLPTELGEGSVVQPKRRDQQQGQQQQQGVGGSGGGKPGDTENRGPSPEEHLESNGNVTPTGTGTANPDVTRTEEQRAKGQGR